MTQMKNPSPGRNPLETGLFSVRGYYFTYTLGIRFVSTHSSS